MKVIETEIEGVKIIEPDVFGDARGWFCEQYNAARYKAAGIMVDDVGYGTATIKKLASVEIEVR